MEKLKALQIEVARKWFVYCFDCQKSLYSPTEDNIETRTIGEQAAISHSQAFSQPHRVAIIKP